MCNELLTFVTFDGIQKSANYKERQDTPTRAQITKRGTWHTSSAPAKGHKWPSRLSQNTEGAASASFAQKTILLIWFNLLWLIQKTRYTWCEGGTEAIGSMKHVKCTSNESHIPQHTLKSSEGMASTCFDDEGACRQARDLAELWSCSTNRTETETIKVEHSGEDTKPKRHGTCMSWWLAIGRTGMPACE